MHFTVFPEIWLTMHQQIANWTDVEGSLQVILGPVFDHDGDGLRDVNVTLYVQQLLAG